MQNNKKQKSRKKEKTKTMQINADTTVLAIWTAKTIQTTCIVGKNGNLGTCSLPFFQVLFINLWNFFVKFDVMTKKEEKKERFLTGFGHK